MRVVSSRPRPIKRDWRAILTDAEARSLTSAEVAAEQGVKVRAVYDAAWAAKIRLSANAAAHAERMRERHRDPEFAAANAERMRERHRDPAHNPLVLLTDAERVDYDILKRAGYSREEALRAVGRVDLITATARGRK